MAGIPPPSDDPSSPTIFPGVTLTVLSPYLGAVFLETWLYGIYCILFSICIYVLLRRNRALHWVLFVFAVLMFCLASADIGYTLYLVFGKLLDGDLPSKMLYPKYAMFVTNGVLADTLLMYRCFVVWGRKKRVVFGPFLFLIATAVCGYLFEGAVANLFQNSWVYLVMTFGLNVILTCLTAGRIWYLRRMTESLIGEGLLQRYSFTLKILIESGIFYSTYIVLDLALRNNPSAKTILDAGLIQIVGIVPTLIIVQVALGRTMRDLKSDPLDRIEANRAASRSFIGTDGHRSMHDARSFREAIRSQRCLSDATMNSDRPTTARSVKSRGEHSSFAYYDYPNGSVTPRTLYGMGSDKYTMPSGAGLLLRPSAHSLPSSPVLPTRPEATKRSLADWALYHPMSETVSLAPSRVSNDDATSSYYYSPV